MYTFFFFFFSSRRRHTRWNCDWSSDVCSSDLASRASALFCRRCSQKSAEAREASRTRARNTTGVQIGRASCRGKSVDLGGRGSIKKKKQEERVRGSRHLHEEV